MSGGGYFTLRDRSNEVSTVSFRTAAITAVSLPGTLTQFGALRAAIDGITAGSVTEEGLYVNRTRLSNVPPTDPLAQRENKFLVVYEDTTAFFDDPVNAIPNEGFRKVFVVEVPTADLELANLFTGTNDDVNLSQPQIAAFITAFEDLVRTPYGGRANVVRMTYVGRNI